MSPWLAYIQDIFASSGPNSTLPMKTSNLMAQPKTLGGLVFRSLQFQEGKNIFLGVQNTKLVPEWPAWQRIGQNFLPAGFIGSWSSGLTQPMCPTSRWRWVHRHPWSLTPWEWLPGGLPAPFCSRRELGGLCSPTLSPFLKPSPQRPWDMPGPPWRMGER